MAGVAQGMLQYVGALKHFGVDPRINLCFPANTEPGQLVKDAVDYMKKYPHMKISGGDMAFLAILSKYSCSINEPKDKPSQP